LSLSTTGAAGIAAALGVTSQAVSHSVAGLERLGYVARQRAESDGRRRLVALTASGAAVVEAGRRARAELSGEIARALGEDRARTGRGARRRARRARAMDAVRGRRIRSVA
jgi:DNA-binding MarR family transcriptional regulator